MRRLMLLAALLLLGCPPDPKPQPVPTPAPATCESVCAHGADLHCSWAEPTAGGASCKSVCENAQEFGDRWNLDCRQNSPSCMQTDQCEQR